MSPISGRAGDVPLAAWEAVLPGVILPLLALWLGGSTWSGRLLAAAANVAPVAGLALIALVAGRRLAALQATATLVYATVAAGWLGAATGWEVGPLPLLGGHVAFLLPLVAAGAGVFVFVVVAAVVAWIAGPGTLARR